MQIQINVLPHLSISKNGNVDVNIDLRDLVQLLIAIEEGSSLAKSTESMNLSYRSIWNRVRDAEKIIGRKLVNTVKGHGSTLTHEARQLITLIQSCDNSVLEISHQIEKQITQGIQSLGHSKQTWKMYASNDPLLEEILEEIEFVEVRTMGSNQAIDGIMRGSCDLAGFHVPDGESTELVMHRLQKENFIAIPVMRRTQGLMIAKGNPLKIKKIQDLARPEVRFINRQKGAGTRLYLEQLLEKNGLDHRKIRGFNKEEFTHTAVANSILVGASDVGMGLEHTAVETGLDFLPMGEETYFLAMDAEMAKKNFIKNLIKNLRLKAQSSSGYTKVQLRVSKA